MCDCDYDWLLLRLAMTDYALLGYDWLLAMTLWLDLPATRLGWDTRLGSPAARIGWATLLDCLAWILGLGYSTGLIDWDGCLANQLLGRVARVSYA